MIRFIHISDTHIGPTKDFLLHGVNTYDAAQKVFEAIRELPFTPDFIIHTGDVATDPDVESYKLYSSIVSDIQIPIYYVTGNHDESKMIISGLQNGKNTPLIKDKLVYKYDLANIRFIVLDGRGPREIDPHGTISEKQLSIVKKELETSPLPVVVFIHFPLLPLDCRWVDRDMLLFEGQKLHELFKLYKDKIHGVFFGHVHQETSRIQDGIRYMSVGSTCLQFGLYPEQDTPSFEDHGRGYFNIVTIEDENMVVKETSVKF